MSDSFGATLTRIRTARGVSQSELARRTGQEHSFYSRLQHGHRQPSLATVEAIAAALGCTPGERDALLLAAGFAPRILVEEPAVGELVALMASDALDERERLRLRTLLTELVGWARERAA